MLISKIFPSSWKVDLEINLGLRFQEIWKINLNTFEMISNGRFLIFSCVPAELDATQEVQFRTLSSVLLRYNSLKAPQDATPCVAPRRGAAC